MMQKSISKLLRSSIIILALLAFLLAGSGMGYADEPASVDDLFGFLVENWYGKFDITTSLSVDETEANKEANLFTSALRGTETRFGHLAEYWELRAYFDLRPEDEARLGAVSFDPGYNWPRLCNELELNPEMLEKALKVDPSRGSAAWFLGRIRADEQYPGVIKSRVYSEEQFQEFLRLEADAYSNAASAEPTNGFYPMFEAAKRTRLGDDLDEMYELIRRAASSEEFVIPSIFPVSYAWEHMDDYEKATGVLAGIKPSVKYHMYYSFYGDSYMPNYVQVKNACKAVIAKSITDGDWKEKFTIVHRAACKMGQGYLNDSIAGLVPIVLIKYCAKEGMNIAQSTGDKDLEIALAVMAEDAETIKHLWASKNFSIDSLESEMSYIYGNLLKLQSEDPLLGAITGDAFEKVSQLFNQSLPMRMRRDFKERYDNPIFAELESFDYDDPSAWYDKWYAKQFPPPE